MSKYMPYNFNDKYEYKIYKNIGWDYKKSKLMNRKDNISQRKYKVCNTYSEWKNHIIDTWKGMSNCDDFLHLLIYRKNYLNSDLEVIKIIYIPLYISGFSAINYDLVKNVASFASILGFGIVFIILILSYRIHYIKRKINFYNDVIEIIKSEKKKELVNSSSFIC